MNWSEIVAAVKDATWRRDLPDTVSDRFTRQALREFMSVRDWWWLRKEATFTASTPTAQAPADFGAVEALFILDATTTYRYPLTLYSLAQLRARWDAGDTGEPVDYAIEGSTFYFGPEPDKTETFALIYRVSESPSGDTWSNPVTTTYPQLLIDLAAGKVLQSYYMDRDGAAPLFQSYDYALSQLEYEDDRRTRDDFTGMVQPDNALYLAAHPSGRTRL